MKADSLLTLLPYLGILALLPEVDRRLLTYRLGSVGVSFQRERRYRKLDMGSEQVKRGTKYVWTEIGQQCNSVLQGLGSRPYHHVVERSSCL